MFQRLCKLCLILTVWTTTYSSGILAMAQNPIEHVSNTGSAIQVPWTRDFSIPKFSRPYARLNNIEWYIQPSLTVRASVRNGGSSNIFSNISGNSRLTVRNITSFDQTAFVSASSVTSTTIRPGFTSNVSASGLGSATQGLIDQSDWARFQGSGSVIFQGSAPPGTPFVTGGGQVQTSSQEVFGGIRIRYFYTDIGLSQADPVVPSTAAAAVTFTNFPSGRWVSAGLPGAGWVYTSTTPGTTFTSMKLPVNVYGKFAVTTNSTQFEGVFGPGATVAFEPGTVSRIHLHCKELGNGINTLPVELSLSSATTNLQVNRIAAVTGSHLLYRDSAFQANGGVAAALESSKLLSSAKEPLSSSFANVSNYSRGINSVVLDIANVTTSNLTATDFIFRLSPTQTSGVVTPRNWSSAPPPTAITVTPGSANTPARVQVDWQNNAIENNWLQVVVQPTSRTGLSHPAVFYVGHAYGEINGVAPYRTSVADLSMIQPAISTDLVDVTDMRDLNKDRRVSVADATLLYPRIATTITLNTIVIPARGSPEE